MHERQAHQQEQDDPIEGETDTDAKDYFSPRNFDYSCAQINLVLTLGFSHLRNLRLPLIWL